MAARTLIAADQRNRVLAVRTRQRVRLQIPEIADDRLGRRRQQPRPVAPSRAQAALPYDREDQRHQQPRQHHVEQHLHGSGEPHDDRCREQYFDRKREERAHNPQLDRRCSGQLIYPRKGPFHGILQQGFRPRFSGDGKEDDEGIDQIQRQKQPAVAHKERDLDGAQQLEEPVQGTVKLWHKRFRLSHLVPDSWRVVGFAAAVHPTTDRTSTCGGSISPTSSAPFCSPCHNLTVPLELFAPEPDRQRMLMSLSANLPLAQNIAHGIMDGIKKGRRRRPSFYMLRQWRRDKLDTPYPTELLPP